MQVLLGFAAQCVYVCNVTKTCNTYFVTQDKKTKQLNKKKIQKCTNKRFSEHTDTQSCRFSLYDYSMGFLIYIPIFVSLICSKLETYHCGNISFSITELKFLTVTGQK